MERKKALIASTIVAASMMTAAVAYAASSGLTDTGRDGVGQLQPATTPGPGVTVIIDPLTGAARAVTTIAPTASGTATATRTEAGNDGRHEAGEREHDDD